MLLIPLINYGPLVLQRLCGCVGIATFIEKDISKGCPFLLYKAQKGDKER